MGAWLSTCQGGMAEAKVTPDPGEHRADADIMQTQNFVPPIPHLSKDHAWLPLLTPSQLVEIFTAFKKFDRDNDGHIEPHELRTVMKGCGVVLKAEDAAKIIAAVDTDNNGKIEFEEFVGIMAQNMLKESGEIEMLQAFQLFDPMETGFVELKQLRDYLSNHGSRPLSTAELDQITGMLSADANGRVAMRDFKALDCWKLPEPPRAGGAATRTDDKGKQQQQSISSSSALGSGAGADAPAPSL